MRRRSAGLTAVLTVLLALLPRAAQAEDGSWWYTRFGVDAAHSQGITGAGVTIAVIDGGINPDAPVFEGANLTVHEPSFATIAGEVFPATSDSFARNVSHGTAVVAQIVGNGLTSGEGGVVVGVAPDAEILFYADDDPDGTDADLEFSNSAIGPAIVQAVDDGARIISLSSFESLSGSRDAVQYALHEGVIIVQGLPNSLIAMHNGLPMDSHTVGDLGGVVAVGSIDANGDPAIDSNGDLPPAYERITVRAPGVGISVPGGDKIDWGSTGIASGTSLATPIVAGMLADLAQMYPEATNNQLLQSLIRNTGGADHPLGSDAVYGYGIVSLKHMMKVDPTVYPDVNPLLSDEAAWDGDITAEDVETAQRPEWAPPLQSPSVTSTSSEPSEESSIDRPSAGVPLWAWASGAGVVVLVLVGGLALVWRTAHRTG